MPGNLTKADEKALVAAGAGSMFWRAMPWLVFVAPLLFVLAAVADLSVASQLGEYERYSLRQIIGVWFSPNSAEVYSGLQLEAVKRIESAVGKALLALVFGGVGVIASIEQRRKRRLCELLLLHGLIKDNAKKT